MKRADFVVFLLKNGASLHVRNVRMKYVMKSRRSIPEATLLRPNNNIFIGIKHIDLVSNLNNRIRHWINTHKDMFHWCSVPRERFVVVDSISMDISLLADTKRVLMDPSWEVYTFFYQRFWGDVAFWSSLKYIWLFFWNFSDHSQFYLFGWIGFSLQAPQVIELLFAYLSQFPSERISKSQSVKNLFRETSRKRINFD